jgi:hypothetical protein
MSSERHVTVSPKKELKLIYPEPAVSEEAKEAFLDAYNELEMNYLRLKQSLSHYIIASKKPAN